MGEPGDTKRIEVHQAARLRGRADVAFARRPRHQGCTQGDASVPFRFDVHALYFSEDAVTLENELHRHFSDRRVNWVNMRREFFFATAAEVRAVLAEKLGNLLEFTEHVESTEYLQSVHYWPAVVKRPGPILSNAGTELRGGPLAPALENDSSEDVPYPGATN